MLDFLQEQGEAVRQALGRILDQKRADLTLINSWGADVCVRLKDFTIQGKMVRGKLVLLSYLMFRDALDQAVLEAAAAMELFHSAFLIHDDIMDRDLTRRGYPTLFAQYQKWGESRGFPDPHHFGQSMGVCAGDIAFFLAVETLSRVKATPSVTTKLLQLCAREIAYVGIAQMQDVFLGSWKGVVDEENVYTLYTYKTGRYTFSLPMMMGALLAEQDPKTLSHLEKIGEYLGIIFQIRDDELGLFGYESEIGKPIGTDLREGKQTLHYLGLLKRADAHQREKLSAIMGKQDITIADIDYVRRLVIELGIKSEIDERISQLSSQARHLIDSMEGSRPECRKVLLDLLEYDVNRTR
jgi:geranylgeranyl diphosphate synthase type I